MQARHLVGGKLVDLSVDGRRKGSLAEIGNGIRKATSNNHKNMGFIELSARNVCALNLILRPRQLVGVAGYPEPTKGVGQLSIHRDLSQNPPAQAGNLSDALHR